MIRFKRTDRPTGGVDYLTIVSFYRGVERKEFLCVGLDEVTPFAVEVSTTPEAGGDEADVYDLDGEAILLPGEYGPCRWRAADVVPPKVTRFVQEAWGCGLVSLERVTP